VASVQRVTSIMGEIARAGQEQEVGIEQIDEAITQMAKAPEADLIKYEEPGVPGSFLRFNSF
jgi:methyl-accepting chemotaxis protein